jgi:hypothetical protein
MKKKGGFDERPADDILDHYWELTSDDLEDPELAIYNSTLPRLANPSPEQLRMLAAYSWAASELKKAAEGDDQALAIWCRECMIFARNGLGIAGPRFIDLMELLLRWEEGWPPVDLSLDSAWQLGVDQIEGVGRKL